VRASGALDGMIALAQQCLAELTSTAGSAEAGSILMMWPCTGRTGVSRARRSEAALR
jgi:hypothetical protein